MSREGKEKRKGKGAGGGEERWMVGSEDSGYEGYL